MIPFLPLRAAAEGVIHLSLNKRKKMDPVPMKAAAATNTCQNQERTLMTILKIKSGSSILKVKPKITRKFQKT